VLRILVTGSSGILGRVAVPHLRAAGHELRLPSQIDLDLFDATQITAAVREADAVVHLATRIPPPDQRDTPGAWNDNDRLRDNATGLLVQAALSADTAVIVVPTVAFIYPPGPADESTPPAEVPDFLQSALRAEEHLRSFTAHGQRGVALRLGSLYGPQAATPTPAGRYSAHLHTSDAATAITAALTTPAGIYNIVDDADTVSHTRFTQATGWHPRAGSIHRRD
jgi:nucleoside-diphosphate-sugar epimerase